MLFGAAVAVVSSRTSSAVLRSYHRGMYSLRDFHGLQHFARLGVFLPFLRHKSTGRFPKAKKTVGATCPGICARPDFAFAEWCLLAWP
jgi:hypothetical protein